MKRFFLLAAFAALVACAPPQPFDPSTIQSAGAQQIADDDVCMQRARNKEIQKASDLMDCFTAAKAAYVTRIKLKQMDLFAAYSTRMKVLGQEADAGQIAPDDFVKQLGTINADFNNQLGAAYQENATERAQAAAKWAAFGQAMQNASANLQQQQALQAQQAQQNKPLNCSSYKVGFTVQTTCN